ncbi:MAG: class I SAM-dependent methyltransferase [Blastococcus sp.]
MITPSDSWSSGRSYEAYVGGWSRLVARRFVPWLAAAGGRWLDVGCGTGALTETVLAVAKPVEVIGVDPSAPFLEYASHHVAGPASFRLGDAQALPVDDASFDVVVSGLVLNFVPDRRAALAEMRRATRPGGTVGVYVWDYPGEMQLVNHFWDAAVILDPAARPLHEGVRFDFCRPEPLRALFVGAGLRNVEVTPIEVPVSFAGFDDYWSPFLQGTGPAPAYTLSLGEAARTNLRDTIRARLPTDPDGSIHLTVRAWGVRGTA